MCDDDLIAHDLFSGEMRARVSWSTSSLRLDLALAAFTFKSLFLLRDQNVDAVARFAGGNNAGHTVLVDGVKYDFHLLPRFSFASLHPRFCSSSN